MNCPKCVGKLQKTVVTSFTAPEKPELGGRPEKEGLEVDRCFSCGGIWFDHGELERYLKARLAILDSPVVGGQLDQHLDEKEAHCPRCNRPMHKAPAPRSQDVGMDVCGGCGGVWLDSTEIDRLERAKTTLGVFMEFLLARFERRDSQQPSP